MSRYLRIFLLALAAAFAVQAGPLSAQDAVRATGPGAGLGFSWGWDGGLTRGPNGRTVMQNPPVVRTVAAHSAAARAGLRVGDIIVSANGRDGRTPRLFEGIRPGTRLVLRIRRVNAEREVTFRMPAPPTQS
ncbi:MAG TPA: PDZ domain-containing protein [Longimicrobium sp.]|jgi:S1-C subfamily serine protease|uniref:PDZ domain-containing protein n=1 Tax=Longimicrobium sp. TaxID=2029185 RepID=UPI002EDA46EE